MRAHLIIAVTLLLAGCIDEKLAPSASQVSARQNQDLAVAAASAWDPKAQLASVVALESHERAEPFDADGTVADGLATAWVYGFVSEGGTARAYRVGADGTVIALDEGDAQGDLGGGATPLGDGWRVDSRAAVQTALSASVIANVIARPDAAVLSLAQNMDGPPRWYVLAFAGVEEDGDAAVAMVDAIDGTLEAAERWGVGMTIEMPGYAMQWGPTFGTPVTIQDEVSLGASAPGAEYPFRLDASGMDGRITMEDVEQLPTQTIVWEVLDHEGAVVASGRFRSEDQSGSARDETFSFEKAGDHLLRFTVEEATPPTPLDLRDVSFAFTFEASWLIIDIEIGP